MSGTAGSIIKGLVVPGLPQPLLAPDENEGWGRIRRAFERARDDLLAAEPDLLLVYSTMWPSVIGHQIQADPSPEWVHVDELFHDLGSIPYRFRIDAPFAEEYCRAARARGLHARTIAYHGFPIDTGSVVALKLLTPNNEVPACIVSSNVYADRAETIVLGKAARDAVAATGRRAVAVVVTSLSNRLFTEWIDPKDDHIHSPKDDEWNAKMLEFLGDGRLEDVSQLSREIHKQVRVKKVVVFKPMWWLSAAMGQHNDYTGKVWDYAPIYGAGAAVVTLTPSPSGVGNKEFDEEDVDRWRGDRSVLDRAGMPAAGDGAAAARAFDDEHRDERAAVPPEMRETTEMPAMAAARPADATDASTKPLPGLRQRLGVAVGAGATITTDAAPAPVGAYPHARKVGDLLFLSGVGPRRPGTGEIPGGPIRDAKGAKRDYDVEAQTRATIANVKAILEAAGGKLEDILDVTVFLVDMDRDFATYNRVYAELLGHVGATRTTLAVTALPTPIAVELKVLARAPA